MTFVVSPYVQTKSPVSRKSYARLPQIVNVPNLIEVQLNSFQRFQESGLGQLLGGYVQQKG